MTSSKCAKNAVRKRSRSPGPNRDQYGSMKDLGYGEGYRYAHDEPDAYAAGEAYLPDGMKPVRWYEPTEQGVDQRIRERLRYLRGLDRQRKGPDST